MRLIWIGLFTACLAACSQSRSDLKLLESTLDNYNATLRWGDPEQLLAFMQPGAPANATQRFAISQLQQLHVASYRAEAPVMLSPERARQRAQADVVNTHTQVMRSYTDVSEWRYDREAKRWWLVSGLPRFQGN